MHSEWSDGTDAPAAMVQKAALSGVGLMALTDHDCVLGVDEALSQGVLSSVTVLPAVEMDTNWPGEMHILGLGIDVTEPRLAEMLETARLRRAERNVAILELLDQAGYPIGQYLSRAPGSATRLHIALALVEAGYAENLRDAFARYLRKGCPGFYAIRRFTPEEVVAGILGAGGVPIWAHPFHGGQNVHQMLEMLYSAGIQGIEVYHPSASAGESEILLSLAQQYRLLVTCGSDCHGANRPAVSIGCTWRDTPELAETYHFFTARAKAANVVKAGRVAAGHSSPHAPR